MQTIVMNEGAAGSRSGPITDAELSAEFVGADPGLVLPQDANDLLSTETALTHRLSSRLENELGSGCIDHRHSA